MSAKQVADRHPDPILQGPESSQYAAGWWQSHPVDFTCDGMWHTQSFLVSDAEYQTGTSLAKGQAWIQFCLTTPDFSGIVMDTRWAAVN